MSDVTSRFTINGTDYDYTADVIVVEWTYDADRFKRVDGVIESDVRRQVPRIQFESVLVAQNANATGTSAAELYDLIRKENAAGNTCAFIPDIAATGGTGPGPVQVDIVTRGSPPVAYQTEQGAERLRRSLTIQGNKWLDPSDTSPGGDKEVIDDLNSLSDPL